MEEGTGRGTRTFFPSAPVVWGSARSHLQVSLVRRGVHDEHLRNKSEENGQISPTCAGIDNITDRVSAVSQVTAVTSLVFFFLICRHFIFYCVTHLIPVYT